VGLPILSHAGRSWVRHSAPFCRRLGCDVVASTGASYQRRTAGPCNLAGHHSLSMTSSILLPFALHKFWRYLCLETAFCVRPACRKSCAWTSVYVPCCVSHFPFGMAGLLNSPHSRELPRFLDGHTSVTPSIRGHQRQASAPSGICPERHLYITTPCLRRVDTLPTRWLAAHGSLCLASIGNLKLKV
jgi:hypothetical protein